MTALRKDPAGICPGIRHYVGAQSARCPVHIQDQHAQEPGSVPHRSQRHSLAQSPKGEWVDWRPIQPKLGTAS
eukprot:CAMPEP_0204166302 /NCGR_PEP_ID=MMETSP0361-20130328/38880_1 /ASSEMBLY_ACC=CAM_ASM_000343 /TAXON_ID=268821 /ORGANISM="Scrippsiella Hangoei, Strain SHTV-5" /LENGTH=72 /DNA_ID=CAMNT_0051123431 /DNA_START=148 /DNA_END=363 /DNA_ORIENTATION=+